MPADRLLGTLLRSLQTYTDQQDTPRQADADLTRTIDIPTNGCRLLGTAASLLTTLNNPLNVTLLTSQLLSAPAIWAQPEGLRLCMRCMSVFHSAAQALVRHETAVRDDTVDQQFDHLQPERMLPKDDWIRVVISGADQHSPRWRHLLVIGGLLLGFGPVEDETLSRSMRNTVEQALTNAINLSLEEVPEDDELGQQTIALVVNHCFPLLSDLERAQIDYDRLLPVLIQSILHSGEGLRSAYFLGVIDLEVQPTAKKHFLWPERSQSFHRLQQIASSPLVASLGPLSRLIGHSVEHVQDPWLVTAVIDELADFAKTLHLQWRQNKLSEVDASEEQEFLAAETLSITMPVLWKLLRSTLFAAVIILRSALGRLLGDGALATDEVAPGVATQALQILRSLYFITTRSGSATFSQYTFVNLTATDVLSAYPQQAESLLRSIKPTEVGSIPQHPLERNLDLFFLNTAEHFTLVLPSHTTEHLLVPAASPYLAAGGNNHLLRIFEAAHSVMLAAFSSPQNAALTSQHLPYYVNTLFAVFPANLSAHQFRLAFKTLIQITTLPAPLSQSQRMLSATLLELLYERACRASRDPMPPQPAASTPEAALEDPVQLSEQAVLVLTVIDTLTRLPLNLLDEWLPLSAELLNMIDDVAMREYCKEHFWHVFVAGGMDPDRSQVCHGWWSSSGGREMVLFGRESNKGRALEMSGAIPDTEAVSCKL